MTALQLIKDDYKSAMETFEGTVGDITENMLYVDAVKAIPLGATYAHLVFSEDVIVNGMIQGKPFLFETDYKDKTGASEPMPAMDEKWSENNLIWSKKVKFDLPKLIEYKKAVFSKTQEYLESLKDEDLDREVDLGSWGTKTVAFILYSMVIGHMNSLSGEISALKGFQGYKGYPF